MTLARKQIVVSSADAAAVTSVASQDTNITLLSANVNRIGATIFNTDSGPLYVKFGATATATTSFTVKIVEGGYYEFPQPVYRRWHLDIELDRRRGHYGAHLMPLYAGSPDILLAANTSLNGGMYLSNSASMPGAGRWLSIPIGATLASGDYWIAFLVDTARIDIANDGSGSDRHFTSSVNAISGTYPSAFAVTTTALQYSIRASILS
jgi:hypothetical protein